MATQRRLNHLLNTLTPAPASIGTLKIGDITYEVPASVLPSRLPHSKDLLDIDEPFNLDNLHFLLQKFLLGQDVFLVSQPGPYARRLAMTFARMINLEYEYIALHRDVGETELKQGREIQQGGKLVYVDSPAVSAVKYGRLLIIEGIEKAERGIMPVLNNLLENREMNLYDGTHIIHPHRYALLDTSHTSSVKSLIPAHKNFRVIAIAAPVPPYPGYPLDPPFRSRFQSRFIEPVGASLALQSPNQDLSNSLLFTKLKDIILSTQYASESRHALEVISRSTLPHFPQTALQKLHRLITKYPPPDQLSSGQLARLLLTIHPALLHATFQAWALLSGQMEEAGLGTLGSPFTLSSDERIGIFGYRVIDIQRASNNKVLIVFDAPHLSSRLQVEAAAGPRALRPFPLKEGPDFHVTERFIGLLTCFLQAHALGYDISLVPPVLPSTSSTSTSTLVQVFGQVLGYDTEDIHLYKELGGRDLVMRRKIEDSGATSWEPSTLIEAAWTGRLVQLSGIDVIGPTAGSLSRLTQDREIELWEGKRLIGEVYPDDVNMDSGIQLSTAHSSFRIIATASKSMPIKDWLSDEHANMFFTIPSEPMDTAEERYILLATGCSPDLVDLLLSFAKDYRASFSSDQVQKSRKLGTRSLVRIARRLALFPQEHDLHTMISRTLLAEFLPAVERLNLRTLLADSVIKQQPPAYNQRPIVKDNVLIFPEISTVHGIVGSTRIPCFDPSEDPEGVATHVPHMDQFYDNSLQTGIMRDIAIDLELLGEHLVLLGNQGVGKNKLVDRLCQLLGRPREYIQLHRDTTVNQLMFTTTLEGGIIKHTDSPLLRAIKYGRVIIIDEADKAPEHVVAVFRSLAGRSEMTLSDGRRIRLTRERESDIVVHSKFRLILLANRPGYPFLGNHFLQVLGENFSPHSISNPDIQSERNLISQLAPDLDKDLVVRLVGAFHDLRHAYDAGVLSYPYSLRELINLTKHIQAYPEDSLGEALRNIFDFDIYKPETVDKLAEILEHQGLKVPHLGLDTARKTIKKIRDVNFEPKNTDLDEPKEGKHDPDDKPHEAGNTWAGGTGGRDTAGLGGRGGYKRLYKSGHNIKQVSDKLKDQVPDHIKEQAREMARQELQRRLEELNMSNTEAKKYGQLLKATQAHMYALYDLLEYLAAKEDERVWIKRQTDGELDDSRLTEGLTGEATVYKRRGTEKPEIGRPQMKPKRIRFIFDVSASMYRFQYDGRLDRTLETVVMLMETFNKLSRKDKYLWDIYGHSGDGPEIPLVEVDKPPSEMRDRWKVVEKMVMVPQYAFAGDYTVEAIDKGVHEVASCDADDWFVIAMTDANFGRYGITAEHLKRSMNRYPKVHTALICIGEGAEATWVTKSLPGKAFRVANTGDIPTVLRSILSIMIER